jgi:hypothetical protein
LLLTPTGRLATIEGRIDPLWQASETLRPAPAEIYAVLIDEQKARLALSRDRRMG